VTAFMSNVRCAALQSRKADLGAVVAQLKERFAPLRYVSAGMPCTGKARTHANQMRLRRICA